MRKETGMETRELPEGWKTFRIDEIAKIRRGASPRPISFYLNGTVPWIKIADITKEGKYLTKTEECITEEGAEMSLKLPAGSIIVSNSGTVGQPCILKIKGCIHDGFLNIYDYEKYLLTEYLYYFILTQKFKLNRLANFGGIQKNLNTTILSDLKIIVPHIAEQQKIVDKLDKKIAQIEIMKKEVEKQFDAVLNILESSLSYYLNEKNILTGTILKFSDICNLDKKQINPKSNQAMRLMYVGMEDIESNTGKITLNESIKWDSISSNTFYFNQNHVLYGKLRPYLNKVAEPYFEGRCSTELIPISPKNSCKRDYLAMLLRSSPTIQAAMKNKTGSRMPRADMNEIMKLRVKLPDVSEQEIILQKMKLFTSQLDEIRSTIKIQLNAINQLPASILNEVFGQYQIN